MQPELIQRFFLKQCTPAEANLVADYLKANPAVLEKYLSEEEWNALSVQEHLPDETWDEIWQNIQRLIRARIFVLRIKRLAVAASIILVAGIAITLHTQKKPAEKTFTQTQTIIAPSTEQITIANTSHKRMKVYLEDSSVVELWPASIIKFNKPFPADKRDILLEGEAKFHVAKNKNKPFTVYTDALATTALGTVFSVKKGKTKNTLTVKLFEGKVVIHAIDKNVNGWKDDVYLLPGKQLYFNAALKTIALNDINVKPATAAINIRTNNTADGQLVFNNAPLSNVMDKLAGYYKVKIQYDASITDTMNFTGTISKNDSLPLILKIIGQMNNLDITASEDGFHIVKSQ